ncbi:YkuS family protein [Mechercharimyces sp. CAU 1602]|uniref:YkuS family protein n=1 Tax=Mechercharimyces sp. CAU 1602 TaxID=2973933 RepID=UPI00216169DC|nr:YkuS family protein [Mechercharimyces sp. CAU 1602]MCS1350552.1 YkuS family protein [Mechercharimyces sp. CAU 1602]
MNRRVAVENGLSPVSELLKNQGFDVVEFSQELRSGDCDCCVISGMDKDMTGASDISTGVSVINARGMSPQDVLQEVAERVNLI